ncbi:hypothetical protein [Sphingomonas sp. VNH70]|uniref:hypothetical protein n=1 Tax=Sphingomonas silueang TaxID=3156617 RepID=UPI0032B3702E
MSMILHQISQYLQATGMSETRFGRRAVGDPRLIGDLRNGRQPRRAMVARIEAFIERAGQDR